LAQIRLLDIAHSYRADPRADSDYALHPLDLTWDDGGAYALLGPSGSGKSTLLNILSGLVRPSRGQLLFDGIDVTDRGPRERNIAQVFQFPVIYDTMTVHDNLAFPLRNRRLDAATIRRRVAQVAEILDLTGDLGRRASGLTADAKQRISMGRGLVRQDVAAILFDEPLTVIDPALKWQLRRKLKQHEVHAGAPDEMPDEHVIRQLEQILGAALLKHLAVVHHHDLVGEGQRLGLVVGDVDHGQAAFPRRRSGAAPRVNSRSASARNSSPSATPAAPRRSSSRSRRRSNSAATGWCAAGSATTGSRSRRRPRAPCRRPAAPRPGCPATACASTATGGWWRDDCAGARFPPMKPINQKGWLLILPVLVVVAFSAVIPLMTVVNFSVQDILGPDRRVFVGTEWFSDTLHDPELQRALLRQVIFSGCVLLIEIPLGLGLALLMPARGIASSAALVLLGLPLLIPFNVVGTIWQIFGRADVGLGGWFLNSVLHIGYNYALNPRDAWATVLLVDVWHWTPLVVLLCYAGLRSIPDAFYQAAAVDGASAWSVFRFVQLPKLRGVLTIAVLLRFMDSFVIYTEPFVLTGGGPGDATTFLSEFLTKLAIGQFDVGPAAAFSLIYFLIILLFSWLFYTVLNAQGRAEGPA